jgi:hypothetical protein
MRNNLWDKNIIESYDVRNFHCEFAWLTRVHSIFLIKCWFSLISSFNIKLVQDWAFQFVFFFQDYLYKLYKSPNLIQVDQFFFFFILFLDRNISQFNVKIYFFLRHVTND